MHVSFTIKITSYDKLMQLVVIIDLTSVATGYLGKDQVQNKVKSILASLKSFFQTTSNMSEPIRVVVTGAAGQIGYSLLYMISSGYVFGPDQPVILHLLDIAPMMGVLGGVCMEIDDCALPLVKGKITQNQL